jgi:hypothetical protein
MRGSASVTLLDPVEPSVREKVPGGGAFCAAGRVRRRVSGRGKGGRTHDDCGPKRLCFFSSAAGRFSLPEIVLVGRGQRLARDGPLNCAGWAGPWRGRDERDLLAFALIPLTMRACAADKERRAQSNSSALPSNVDRHVPAEDVLGDSASTSGGRRAERRVARARSGPVRLVCVFDLRSLPPALSASAPWSTYAPTHGYLSEKIADPSQPAAHSFGSAARRTRP